MRMTVDRGLCNHALPECERCFARMMVPPLGADRHCVTLFEEDGDPVLHLTLRYDGHEQHLDLSPDDREMVANLGWSQFVEVMPNFYRA